jgi:hypothetical protein
MIVAEQPSGFCNVYIYCGVEAGCTNGYESRSNNQNFTFCDLKVQLGLNVSGAAINYENTGTGASLGSGMSAISS